MSAVAGAGGVPRHAEGAARVLCPQRLPVQLELHADDTDVVRRAGAHADAATQQRARRRSSDRHRWRSRVDGREVCRRKRRGRRRRRDDVGLRAAVRPRREVVGGSSERLRSRCADRVRRAHDQCPQEGCRGGARADAELQSRRARRECEIDGLRQDVPRNGRRGACRVGGGDAELEVRGVLMVGCGERIRVRVGEVPIRVCMAIGRAMLDEDRPVECGGRQRPVLRIRRRRAEGDRVVDLPGRASGGGRDRDARRRVRRAADRRIHVRLQLAHREGAVVDAQVVDPPRKPLRPDAVAADPQHSRGGGDGACLRELRDLGPVQIEAQEGAVVGRRQVRPRIQRQAPPCRPRRGSRPPRRPGCSAESSGGSHTGRRRGCPPAP